MLTRADPLFSIRFAIDPSAYPCAYPCAFLLRTRWCRLHAMSRFAYMNTLQLKLSNLIKTFKKMSNVISKHNQFCKATLTSWEDFLIFLRYLI